MPVSIAESKKRKAEESEDEEVKEENESENEEEEEVEEGEEGEGGEEPEFEFTCDGCSEGLYTEDTRFHCQECGDYDLCENCFFGEELETTHEHELIEIKEGKILFIHVDDKTGNSLILSDFRAVLPPSNPLKKHNVKSVLSAIDFHASGNCNKDLDKLQDLYSLSHLSSIPSSSTVAREGIVYHHINMPDLQKPSLLRAHGVSHALEEACAFIDMAMARGNTLVHCERGQFRSPTLILSWLITRGMTTDEAIDHIAEDYPGWGKKYTNSRPEWILRLQKWEKDFKKERQAWSTAHHSHTQLWKAKYPSVYSKQQEEKSDNNTTASNEPLKKKVKV